MLQKSHVGYVDILVVAGYPQIKKKSIIYPWWAHREVPDVSHQPLGCRVVASDTGKSPYTLKLIAVYGHLAKKSPSILVAVQIHLTYKPYILRSKH